MNKNEETHNQRRLKLLMNIILYIFLALAFMNVYPGMDDPNFNMVFIIGGFLIFIAFIFYSFEEGFCLKKDILHLIIVFGLIVFFVFFIKLFADGLRNSLDSKFGILNNIAVNLFFYLEYLEDSFVIWASLSFMLIIIIVPLSVTLYKKLKT